MDDIPAFRQARPPKAPTPVRPRDAGLFRGSPRDRGYDAAWDRLSVAFRRKNPFCWRCERLGRDTLAAVADHVIPAADRPDLRLTWSNLQPLCSPCHDGWKQRLETFARETGQLDQLPKWCRGIDVPVQFQ